MLGRCFAEAALRPLTTASHAFCLGDAAGGLACLEADSLRAAIDTGLKDVAKRVGMSQRDVADTVALSSVEDAARRVALSQPRAAEQWEQHAAIGGDLFGEIARVTAYGRAGDVVPCLHRVAEKMALEKGLARAIRDLAADIKVWADELARIRAMIDHGNQLRDARRRRRQKQRLLLLGAVALCAVGLWELWRMASFRREVDAVLGRAHPCEVNTLVQRQRDACSEDQLRRIQQKKQACKKARETEVRQREAARLRRLAEKRKAEALAAQKTRCKRIVALLPRGGAELRRLAAKPFGDALDRLARGRIDVADLALDWSRMDCAAAREADGTQRRFAAAAIRGATAWLPEGTVSSSSRAMLKRGMPGVGMFHRRVFANHVERLAEQAVARATEGSIERAALVCKLKIEMELSHRQHCTAALGIMKSRQGK